MLLLLLLLLPQLALVSSPAEHARTCEAYMPTARAGLRAAAELARQQLQAPPPYEFPPAYVKKALAATVDYRSAAQNPAGIASVTPAKDQGAHGTCGTFGRTAAAEGQYALRSGHPPRNFSEEELVDCQWQQRGLPVPAGVMTGDPLVWMDDKGFLSSEDYPYHTDGPECHVYNYTYNNTCFPCAWQAGKVITGSSGNWTGIASARGEEQMAAFVHHNGPIWVGINSHAFGLRDNVTNQVLACNGTSAGGGGSPDNCFVTRQMCTDGRIINKGIDHAVTVVGYSVDSVHGPYWHIKNSWSQKFGNAGFIKVARGIECAGVSSGNTNTYANPSDYRCPHNC
jgi:hypothetical protein